MTNYNDLLLCDIPEYYSDEYYEFLDSVNTSIIFDSWINEMHEDELLENYGVTPGELNAKLEKAEWLLHSCYELSKIQEFREVGKSILKTKIRLKYGVKEELLPLLKLEGIGRIRARKMFSNGIKDLGDVKKTDLTILSQLLGKNIALSIKKQVGQEFDEKKIIPEKTKGQLSLKNYN